jgi:hypothetical protein
MFELFVYIQLMHDLNINLFEIIFVYSLLVLIKKSFYLYHYTHIYYIYNKCVSVFNAWTNIINTVINFVRMINKIYSEICLEQNEL